MQSSLVEFPMAEVIALPSASQSPGAPSFADLVRDHWEAVYRLARTMTSNDHDADDLAQETFLRGWTKFATFRSGTNLRSWLLKIASNAFLDEQRRRKRLRSAELNDELPGPVQDMGRTLEISEQAVRLRQAMAQLTELSRIVFHLRATEGLSFREIAEIAGTTEQSARWHMHHARSRLLEILGEKDAES